MGELKPLPDVRKAGHNAAMIAKRPQLQLAHRIAVIGTFETYLHRCTITTGRGHAQDFAGRRSRSRNSNLLRPSPACADMLIEWLSASQRGGGGDNRAVLRPAGETGGRSMVDSPLQIRSASSTAARAPTGSGLPTGVEPPTA